MSSFITTPGKGTLTDLLEVFGAAGRTSDNRNKRTSRRHRSIVAS